MSARIPPSPSLSDLNIMTRYFILTTRIKDQKTKDKMPKILSSVTVIPCLPVKQTLKEYSGLVPISPNTTPKAPMVSFDRLLGLSLIHISEPTRQAEISYAVFCLK